MSKPAQSDAEPRAGLPGIWIAARQAMEFAACPVSIAACATPCPQRGPATWARFVEVMVGSAPCARALFSRPTITFRHAPRPTMPTALAGTTAAAVGQFDLEPLAPVLDEVEFGARVQRLLEAGLIGLGIALAR